MFCAEFDRGHFFGWILWWSVSYLKMTPGHGTFLRAVTQPEENAAKRGQNATSNVACFSCMKMTPTYGTFLRVITHPTENVATRDQNATSNVVIIWLG